jgi:cytolysin (calcineurin-like family phosphatase)
MPRDSSGAQLCYDDKNCGAFGGCGGPGLRNCSANAPGSVVPCAKGLGKTYCEPSDPPAPKLPLVSPDGPLDVTFLVATDVHFSAGSSGYTGHARNVHMLNTVTDKKLRWLAKDRDDRPLPSAGTLIAEPAGVVLTGDLTHSGHFKEIAQLRSFYQKRAATDPLTQILESIRYPVFPGTGNHDVYGNCDFPWTYNFCGWGVLDYIRDRVGDGQWGVTSFDDGSRNYSWDWNAVHLVQLNAWAGDIYAGRTNWENPDSKPRATHPSGLPWLREDLRRWVGDSNRPVIVFQHFDFGTSPLWWTLQNQKDFLDILKPYNVIGVFTGHAHSEAIRNVGTLEGLSGYDLDEFRGSNGGAEGGGGGFYAVHVQPGSLEVSLAKWVYPTGGDGPITPNDDKLALVQAATFTKPLTKPSAAYSWGGILTGVGGNCLAVDDPNSDGSPTAMQTCDPASGKQRWRTWIPGAATFTRLRILADGGKALGTGTNNAAAVASWGGHARQAWELQNAEIVSGISLRDPKGGLIERCMDVKDGNKGAGATVQLWSCGGGDHQRWTLQNMGNIKGKASGLCLAADSEATGAELKLATCAEGARLQQWVLQPGGGLRLLAAGKCAGSISGGVDEGTRLVLTECQPYPVPTRSWLVRNAEVRNGEGKCLDVKDGKTAPGTAALLWTCNGGSNQRWTYKP